MPESCKVYITARTPSEAQAAGSEGEVLPYSESDPLRTLQSLVERQPDTIALDHDFAASPRGLALIERLRADPVLAGAEIVVVLADGSQYRYGPGLPATSVPKAPPREPAKEGAMRRAPRVALREGTRMRLDFQDAVMVDLSVLGAQVLSPTPLQPGRVARATLLEDDGQVTMHGVVVWARLEMAPGQTSPCYRAGLAFTDPNPVAVLRFCGRHRAERPAERDGPGR
jgi:CHASE2 domain-containing sensor protein